MKRLLVVLCVLFAVKVAFAARYNTRIYDENIKTLQVLPNGEFLHAPVIELNSADEIVISFDELGYEASNFYYRIVHCDAHWNKSNISSMEYLDGFDGDMIDEYEYSINTTVNYIHYKISFPNSDVKFRLSGNYAVEIARDGNFDVGLVAVACFSIVEPFVDIKLNVSGRAMNELNGRYQALELDIDVAAVGAIDKIQDFIVVVRQNKRLDSEVCLKKPSYVRGNKLRYENLKELIFEAGNQYRSVDFSSRYTYGAGIEHIEFDEGMYHVVLEPAFTRDGKQEAYLKDAHGGYIVNLQKNDNSEVEADYMWVYFYYIPEDKYDNSKMFLLGDLTYNLVGEESEMVYDKSLKGYVKPLLLKQGGYNYIYALKGNNVESLSVTKTEGSYWQSINRYDVMVYYRPFGARYDRLIGVAISE